jgi:mycothiol S-conjugate amidase
MSEPLRLVSVLTRQGDEPGEGSATLARYVAAGHEVMVVTCVGDESAAECDVAAVSEVLGVGHHRLGFTGSARDTVERLVRVLREFRPHVMVIYDDGVAGDPDRVRCREAAVAAFDAAGDPVRFPDAGEPWQPTKLYYVHEWYETRMRTLHEALLAEDLDSPYHAWLEEPVGGAGRITTRVPCGEYFPAREQVLRAHAARLTPGSHWFAVPVSTRQAAWPTEDFELARSHVETSLPENDLFAGISRP